MRKKPFLILLMIISINLIVGCNVNTTDNGPQDEELYYSPIKDQYNFRSYSELNEFLSVDNLIYLFPNEELLDLYGSNFKKFVYGIERGEKYNIFPQIYKEDFELQNIEGFYNITLFTCELYNQPWLWYNVIIDNNPISIRIMLSNQLLQEDKYNISTSEVIKKIAPNAPNINNRNNFTNYKNIYESSILVSGKISSTLNYEIYGMKETYTLLQYENTIVCIYGDLSHLGKSAFESLEIICKR